jgi:hypothetical protein
MRALLVAVLVSALFLTSSAHAQALIFAGGNVSFEKANNERNMEAREPFAFRGGWGFSLADVLLEFSTFNVSDGTSYVRVSRQHREWVVWAKRGFQIGRAFNPYASLGTGLQYDLIETTVGGQSVQDDGRPRPLLACAGGMEVRIYKGIEANLEGRLAMSKGYAPNPMPALAFFVGYRF